ncbi:hypothetical protein [Clostridium sp. ZBS20]|uniref:hypothetical protein n=1 Tax=Clostridium sp. ZBS20 TaxID=2949966 RepID=UPI00207A67C0|nr:hypothetical protein [Clostridium sp. ZBS20]
MKLTSNYSLKKPDGSDVVNVQDFNDNSDKIDLELKKVDSSLKDIANDSYPIVEATGTNTYIGSTARITKLSKGTRCTLFIGNNSNGNCSLNLNNYGAKNIKDSFGNIVTNLKTNIPYNLCYNGSDFILQGKGGGGNATADKLLSGSTATVDSGPIAGTMTNQGSKTASLNCGGSYIIPAGYHSGNGKVTANSLVSQLSSSTLTTANQLISGIKAYSKSGVLLTGTAENSNYISGTLTDVSIYRNYTVSMDFVPKVVVIWSDNERLSINCPSGRTGTKGLLTRITSTGFYIEVNTNWSTLHYYAIR